MGRGAFSGVESGEASTCFRFSYAHINFQWEMKRSRFTRSHCARRGSQWLVPWW